MTDAEKAAFFSLLREKGAALMGVADLRGIVAGELQLGVSVAIPVPAEIVRDLQTAPTLAYLEAYAALNAQLNDIVTSGAGFLRERGFAQSPTRRKPSIRTRTGERRSRTRRSRRGRGWAGSAKAVCW